MPEKNKTATDYSSKEIYWIESLTSGILKRKSFQLIKTN